MDRKPEGFRDDHRIGVRAEPRLEEIVRARAVLLPRIELARHLAFDYVVVPIAPDVVRVHEIHILLDVGPLVRFEEVVDDVFLVGEGPKIGGRLLGLVPVVRPEDAAGEKKCGRERGGARGFCRTHAFPSFRDQGSNAASCSECRLRGEACRASARSDPRERR